MKKFVLLIVFVVFLAAFFTGCCPALPSSSLDIDKTVKSDGCNWQKSITAEKGDWVSVRLLVVVTGTIGDVSVKDELKNPFLEFQNLRVNNIPHYGDIVSGISLGTLKDESREITFEVRLSPQISQYECGENILVNKAEVWGDYGYKVTSTAEITVYRYCPPPPPPCPPPCPPPIPPPPPPECEDGGPGPDPL